MNKLTKLFIVAACSLSTINPALVIAQTSSATYEPPTYQGVQGSVQQYLCTPSGSNDGRDLERCINKLYRFGVSFGAIALVFFIVLAGYMYITGGESGKAKAKGILQNALVGIGILLGSYVLLSFINPSLVIIRPIQPPIFSAPDFPSCEEVGFSDNCVLPDGSVSQGTGGGGWGERISCPGNKLVSAKSLGLPTKYADEQICEAFGKKLVLLKVPLSGMNWYITDTIGSGHRSSCHGSGNPLSGTCADIGISDKTTANFNKICKALIAIGDLQPVNETKDSGTVQDCGGLIPTGDPHLHVNWRKGGGGG